MGFELDMSEEELELLIDDYLDDRMEPAQRASFEKRMDGDPALRERVMSATRSVQMVQQALGWVTPGEKFDEQVSSKIIEITNSGQNLKPAERAEKSGATDAEAEAGAAEKRRLMLIALIAAVLFGLAVIGAIYAVTHNGQ